MIALRRRDALRMIAATAGWLGARLAAGASRAPIDPGQDADRPGPEVVPAPAESRILALPGVMDVALSADGTLIAAGGRDGILRTYDAETGRLLFAFQAHDHPIGIVRISSDGGRIVTTSAARLLSAQTPLSRNAIYTGTIINVWRRGDPHRFGTLVPPEGRGGVPAFGPSNDHLLLLDREGVASWKIATGELDPDAWRLPALKGGEANWSFGGGSFNADARRAATLFVGERREGDRRRRATPYALGLFEPEADRNRVVYDDEGQLGYALKLLALSPDGRRIAVSSVGTPLDVEGDPPDAVRCLITLLDFDSGAVVSQLQAPPSMLCHTYLLAISPDNARVATASDGDAPHDREMLLRLWDPETGRQLRAFRTPPGPIRAVAFLPDGQLRVVSGRGEVDEPLTVWEAEFSRP